MGKIERGFASTVDGQGTNDNRYTFRINPKSSTSDYGASIHPSASYTKEHKQLIRACSLLAMVIAKIKKAQSLYRLGDFDFVFDAYIRGKDMRNLVNRAESFLKKTIPGPITEDKESD